MTTTTDIANRSLQLLGTRTTIASLSEGSNEAIQSNLIINQLRDDLLRMAPWNCSFTFRTLNLITAAPGTPENTSAATSTWQRGQPAPPWAYEYQYPSDCLRAQVIIPQFTTGFASGIPITTAVTGGSPNWWTGPPVKFKVAVDQFFSATGAAVVAGGAGYAINDFIILLGTPQGQPPIGAPGIFQVLTIGGGGAAATVFPTFDIVVGTNWGLVNQAGVAITGSYFVAPTNPVAQGSTTGAGAGATLNLTFGSTFVDQRVILTNQEFAILGFCRQVTNPNVMDPLFVDAWTAILGARLAMVLTGDKAQANMLIANANNMIIEARKVDGNESLTINDTTPDWIRVRGINLSDWAISPNQGWDWGALFPTY